MKDRKDHAQVDQEQQKRNKEIEKQLNSDKRQASSIVKLLLLGKWPASLD